MLYDPKWEQQTKADPLTLASLIAWLEKQNPLQGYNFGDCTGKCLIGLYMASHDIPWRYAESADTYSPTCEKIFGLYPGGNCPDQSVAADFPHTFGAALDRARKFRRTY